VSPRIALVSAVVLASAAAHADPAADASARLQEGWQLFREGQFARARETFQAAHDILPDARVLANVAACFASEGRTREAVDTYRRFLREAGPDVPPASVAEARSEVTRLVATLGDLVLDVEPAGAEIWLDGAAIGTAPLAGEVALDPGAHRVEVRAEGREPYARDLEVAAGQRLDLRVVLEAPRPAPVPMPMPAPVELVVPPPPAPRETPLGRGPLFWSGAALTGTLLVVGIVTGSIALSQQGAYEEPGTSRARRRELYDSMSSLATATDVLLDTALVLGAATALLWYFGGPEESAPAGASATAAGAPRDGAAWGGALSF
jgi:tetratricopeptide (TPR) repeat protein